MTPEHPKDRAAEPLADVLTTAVCASPARGAPEPLGLKLVHEMRRRWRQGEETGAEEFLNSHPELRQQAESAVDLIYEEFCLRQAAGQEDAGDDVLKRFPQWAGPVRVMLDCHRLLRSGGAMPADPKLPRFPNIGDLVGEFRLLETLGRGLHGRVFLAAQTGLADRLVALKITPLDGGEHLLLARLQHTNIVPLHTVFDDTGRGVRILCMPYFGRVTLADLQQALADAPLAERTGQHIVEALDRLQRSRPAGAVAGAARQMLAQVSYVQAMCWIVASLADALQFAHDRDLVHFDLKPQNVLLATDGQPMLLDFHLACAPILPEGPPPERLGGTLRYMPPEQKAALRALPAGRPVETPVDGRADLYALGAILYEALGGALPLAAGAPRLAQANPRVSVGLSDLVAKCVAERPEDRYAAAAGLADDLRRHLTDQPLVGVANRSPQERWRKWRRRRPNAMRTFTLLGVVAAAAALLLAGAAWHLRDRRLQAEAALRDGFAQMENGGRHAEAAQTFERGLALLEPLPLQGHLRRRLREQLGAAKRLQLAQHLHALADEIRGLGAADALPADRLRSLSSSCRTLWEKRARMADALNPALDPAAAEDWQDIALFLAELELRLAAGADAAAGRRAALLLLDEAEALFGPSAAVAHERLLHRQALGLDAAPEQSGGAAFPPTARERYALGRSYLAAGKLPQAAEALTAALALEPAGRWPNFYFGLCAYRLGRHEEAVTAFSVCIGTAPTSAGCFHNRGLAHAALGRPDQARRDYDRALTLDPTLAAAALNRGLLHFEQKRLEEAHADLNRALRHGADAATVHYNLALVYVAGSDPVKAREQVRLALRHNPNHEPARRLRDTLQDKTSRRPSDALRAEASARANHK